MWRFLWKKQKGISKNKREGYSCNLRCTDITFSSILFPHGSDPLKFVFPNHFQTIFAPVFFFLPIVNHLKETQHHWKCSGSFRPEILFLLHSSGKEQARVLDNQKSTDYVSCLLWNILLLMNHILKFVLSNA